MKQLKVAIIGLGNMGSRHLRVYSELPEAEIVSVAEVNEEKRVEAKKYKAKFYQDFREMLRKERIDAVSICVPTVLHYEIARECIAKRINVLLEKPISDNLKDAEELLNLAKKSEIKLLVGHIERFNPAVRRLQQILDSKILGNLISIIARRIGVAPPRIQDTDIGVDLAIHDIDIINLLLNDLPLKVISHRQNNLLKLKADSVEFFLKYPNISAFVQANWISPVKIRQLSISGELGYLELDYIKQEITLYKSIFKKTENHSNKFSDYILHFSEPEKAIISVAKKEPLKEELRFFIQSILNDRKIDSKFALDALNIALK